jgi:hypothetical protein
MTAAQMLMFIPSAPLAQNRLLAEVLLRFICLVIVNMWKFA